MKYKSKDAATVTLQRFFAQNPDSDEVSISDIFNATGREAEKSEINMSWLSNHLTTLRYYGLVSSVYNYDGRKKLDKIRLTTAGKKALGRIEDEPAEDGEGSGGSTSRVSLDDALRVVNKFKKENPGFEVVFTVKLKD